MANPNKPPGSLRTLLPATALSASSVQNSPVTDDVPLPKRRRAVRTACDYCRDKKIRCSGLQPCPKCVELSQPCVFTGREADRLRQSLDHYKETLEYIYNILQERPEIIAEEVEIFRQIARDSPDVEEFVQRVSIIKRQGSGSVGSSRKQSRSTVSSAKSSFEGRPPSRPGDDEVMADGFGPSLQRIPDGLPDGMADGEISDSERTSVESAPNRKRAKSAMLLDGVDEVDGVDGVDGIDGVDDDEEPGADAESIDEIADFVANQYHSWHPDDIADQRPEQDGE